MTQPALTALLAMLALPAAAQDYDCSARERCQIPSGTCVEDQSRLSLHAQGGRHRIALEGQPEQSAEALALGGGLTFLFGEGDVTHQLQIKPDLRFSYQIDHPDTSATGGFAGEVWIGTCKLSGGNS